jgi:ferredoxin-NADP reductase
LESKTARELVSCVSSTVDEILTRTYLQLGTIALVLMAALAATSTDGIVRRLGARRWKLLHRLVYPIAILGVLHFLLLVKSDIRAPRAFAILLGALLLYRAVRHYLDLRAAAKADHTKVVRAPRRRRFWSGTLKIARIFQETPDVRTFRLALPDGGRLPFEHQPGQYLNLRLQIGPRRVNRSYTIASSPSRPETCDITVKRVPGGASSNYLHDHVAEGGLLEVSAPAGHFTFIGTDHTRVVLIAGGVGITPIMSVVRWLTDRAWPGRIELVLAFRTRADIIFAEELAYLERRFPNLRVTTTLSRPDEDGAWTGPRGHITAELLARVPDILDAPILLCGPEPMMIATRDTLARLGVPPEHVTTEAFVSRPDVEPDAEASSDRGEIPDDARAVRFSRSDRSAEMTPGMTVLECAEESGIAIPFECRSGICGQCKTRLLRGRVVMDVADALSRAERDKGFILACQARAVVDLTVDA